MDMGRECVMSKFPQRKTHNLTAQELFGPDIGFVPSLIDVAPELRNKVMHPRLEVANKILQISSSLCCIVDDDVYVSMVLNYLNGLTYQDLVFLDGLDADDLKDFVLENWDHNKLRGEW